MHLDQNRDPIHGNAFNKDAAISHDYKVLLEEEAEHHAYVLYVVLFNDQDL